jgi:hypothetical protein
VYSAPLRSDGRGKDPAVALLLRVDLCSGNLSACDGYLVTGLHATTHFLTILENDENGFADHCLINQVCVN